MVTDSDKNALEAAFRKTYGKEPAGDHLFESMVSSLEQGRGLTAILLDMEEASRQRRDHGPDDDRHLFIAAL